MKNSLNLGDHNLAGENVPSMLKMLYVGCPDLPLVVSVQFIFEMCATAENCKKSTQTPYFGGSMTFKVKCTVSICNSFTLHEPIAVK